MCGQVALTAVEGDVVEHVLERCAGADGEDEAHNKDPVPAASLPAGSSPRHHGVNKDKTAITGRMPT